MNFTTTESPSVRTDIATAEIALYPAPPKRSPGTYNGFAFRPLDASRDAPLLHRWFVDERASFWNMQDKRVDEVEAVYQALADAGHATAWLGIERGTPAFLIECYDPVHDQIGEHYDVQPGDLGMHLFVAPASRPEHGYTRRVFAALMTFMFARLDARRIVVEPDARNTRIHALNRAMGFVYWKDVAFREKTASIAFCTREDFHAAIQKEFQQ
jgi:RimJ/RimL family protein N-acetyltransferase